MRFFSISLILILFFTGCSAQLRTLMQLDKEQKEQQKYVESQRKKMQMLLTDIRKNKLKVGKITKQDIIKFYGEPIMEKKIDDKQSLLYRDPVDFFPSEKVYLFFDENDILQDFQLETEEPAEKP